jgi:hypothetical protein
MLSGFNFPESRINVGKTLFAQVMEFVPWKTFARIIEQHKGDAGFRTLGCADLFRIMAFSQLTWRESLRDIEVCLEANQSKLFHMGIATPPARSTLADALNSRDWRIYHALALRLIAHARVLYAQDASVPGIDASVYALDSTTIDLCLSLFDWAPFRSTKAAIKKGAPEMLPRVHLVISQLKRWLLGTHQGAVSHKHLDYYLDEFTFRFNRRQSKSRGKLYFRLAQQAGVVDPVPLE